MSEFRSAFNGFSKIDKIIYKAAKEHNLQQAFNKHRVISCWRKVAENYLAEGVELTQAVDLKKGVLVVACLSREIAAKLRVLSERVILAINEFLGHRTVFAIYIEV